MVGGGSFELFTVLGPGVRCCCVFWYCVGFEVRLLLVSAFLLTLTVAFLPSHPQGGRGRRDE